MPTPAVEATKHMIVWMGVCVAVTCALGVLVAFDKGKRVLSTGLPGRLRSTRAAALGTGTGLGGHLRLSASVTFLFHFA